jgi:hypothetical protein
MSLSRGRKQYFESPFRGWIERLDDGILLNRDDAFDAVYDLFKREELSGRKVGRKWLTTRNALLRWIESSSENNTLARAIEREDRHAITNALKSGKAQIKKR